MTGDQQVVLVSVLAVLTIALGFTNQLALARPLGADQKSSDPPSAYNYSRVSPKLFYNESTREIPYSDPSQCSSNIPGVLCPRVPGAAAPVKREININVTRTPRVSGEVKLTYIEDSSRLDSQESPNAKESNKYCSVLKIAAC